RRATASELPAAGNDGGPLGGSNRDGPGGWRRLLAYAAWQPCRGAGPGRARADEAGRIPWAALFARQVVAYYESPRSAPRSVLPRSPYRDGEDSSDPALRNRADLG